MKDNFSAQAGLYAQFRPSYPDELFDYLKTLTPATQSAWDCATGNGQVAVKLADFFEVVEATDISEKQLAKAQRRSNINYQLCPAEQTPFPEHTFDLITVAQAIHWFEFDKFYAEVKRTLKPNGILAVIGYPLLRIDAETDKIIDHFYKNTLKTYWDAERHYLDEHYRTIPFPFQEISAPAFKSVYSWTLTQLTGYLNTWSAVQHYIRKNGKNPVDIIIDDLKKSWAGAGEKKVYFDILLRIGKAENS